MADLNALVALYRPMEWADATVWATVLSSDEAQADETLRNSFYHLHLVPRAFLRTWRGEPRATPYPRFADAQSLMPWGGTSYSEARADLSGLEDEQTSEPMPLAWVAMVEPRLGGAPEVTTMGETI